MESTGVISTASTVAILYFFWVVLIFILYELMLQCKGRKYPKYSEEFKGTIKTYSIYILSFCEYIN